MKKKKRKDKTVGDAIKEGKTLLLLPKESAAALFYVHGFTHGAKSWSWR